MCKRNDLALMSPGALRRFCNKRCREEKSQSTRSPAAKWNSFFFPAHRTKWKWKWMLQNENECNDAPILITCTLAKFCNGRTSGEKNQGTRRPAANEWKLLWCTSTRPLKLRNILVYEGLLTLGRVPAGSKISHGLSRRKNELDALIAFI